MSTDPLADEVSAQYARWVYPEPIADLPAWLEDNWQWFDPTHAHRLFWPNRDKASDLDILVAGCGANQAAVLAFTNPDCRVVGIDVSRPSLDHHRALRETYGLDNLEVHLLPIEDAAELDRDFDLIVSTGVLHHLRDPAIGMAALARRLRPDGVAAIMLYARYGRIGVEMMQGVFRDLDLDQDPASVAIVKAAVATLPPEHPLRPYMTLAPDLEFDAGLVDTFLHGRDRSFTTSECIELVEGAGLVFDDWFLKAPYAPRAGSDNAFHRAVADLPRDRQWAIMERVNAHNGCHFFTACRPERESSTYRVDFTTPGFLDYLPSLRYRCTLGANDISRYDWSTSLDPTQMTLLRLMDGRRSIGDILQAGAPGTPLETGTHEERNAYGRNLFESLWLLDFIALGRRSTG